MKLNNKKYKLRPWVKIVLVVLSLTLVGSLVIGQTSKPKETTKKEELPSATIVIDAGHGVIDSGTIGVDDEKTCEKDLALIYSKEIKKQINKINPNVKVYFTRTSDHLSWIDENTEDFQLDDLNGRTKFINDIHPDFMLSIHFNFCDGPKMHGYTAYTKEKDHISQNIFKKIEANLDKENWSQSLECRSTKDFPLQLVDYVKSPAMLFEVGFLSSPKELKALKEEPNRIMISKSIAQAYCSYIEEHNK